VLGARGFSNKLCESLAPGGRTGSGSYRSLIGLLLSEIY
jgi:hypothetical protein